MAQEKEKPAATRDLEKPSTGLFDTRTGLKITKPIQDAFRAVKSYSAEVTSINRESAIACQLTSEPYMITMPARSATSGPSQASAIDIVNVMTGEEQVLILNTVMRSALERAGSPLVGRCFAFRDDGMKLGKNYRAVAIVEIARNE